MSPSYHILLVALTFHLAVQHPVWLGLQVAYLHFLMSAVQRLGYLCEGATVGPDIALELVAQTLVPSVGTG